MAVRETVNALYRLALHGAAEEQTWPGHFLFKRVETELLLEQVRLPSDGVMLELGCGNGFQSMLLASQCRWLVSTDLMAPNPRTHTVGLGKAKRLLERCGISNVTLVSCDAQALPFPDARFDVVFSSSVLEHVGRRPEAVAEMSRVLKPGGRMIVAVPTHVASLCAFPHQVLYIGVRALQVIRRAWQRRSPSVTERVPTAREVIERDRARGVRAGWKAFWRHHPSFPLPEPHGEYRSVLEELRAQFPRRWRALLEAGGFTIEHAFALTLVPIGLLEVFSPALMAELYEKSQRLHTRVAAHPAAQSMAYIWAAVCRKSAGAVGTVASTRLDAVGVEGVTA